MRYFFWGLILFLIVLHQDYWQWGRSDLVFGFVPYPLAYHVCVSILASAVWLLLVNVCWPGEDDPMESTTPDPDASKGESE